MFAGYFEAAVGAFVNGIGRAVAAGGGPVDDSTARRLTLSCAASSVFV
jgi:hypothetical protein